MFLNAPKHTQAPNRDASIYQLPYKSIYSIPIVSRDHTLHCLYLLPSLLQSSPSCAVPGMLSPDADESSVFSALTVRYLAFRMAQDIMTKREDIFSQYAELVNGRFKCNFCRRDFFVGVCRVKSYRKPKTEADETSSEEICSGTNNCSSIMLDNLLAKFILLNNVDCRIVKSPSFLTLVDVVAASGAACTLPSYSALNNVLIPELLGEAKAHMQCVKESWGETGYTLISDIWCDEKERRSFVNIMVDSGDQELLPNTFEIPESKLTSDSLEVRSELLQLVQSLEWLSSGYHGQGLGKETYRYGSPSGYLYAAMEMATQSLRRIYDVDPTKCQRLWDIFNSNRIVHPVQRRKCWRHLTHVSTSYSSSLSSGNPGFFNFISPVGKWMGLSLCFFSLASCMQGLEHLVFKHQALHLNITSSNLTEDVELATMWVYYGIAVAGP
ncbi:hypothetical protein CRG98_013351 [Punica granatum]|uniref:DUF659 domain-containing protein n=1 Tax=Punica granatum TaxID=22663 RepID=A0A2I0KDF6_PUNGR|nr:hypothetical protein CRG98_013351 [Punica granatum]